MNEASPPVDPIKVLRRLRTGDNAVVDQHLGHRPYQGVPYDRVRRVLTVIRAVGDTLDMQAFAHPEVATMSNDEVGSIYRVLTRDRDAIHHHQADERTGACTVDGEAWPCLIAQTVMRRYL